MILEPKIARQYIYSIIEEYIGRIPKKIEGVLSTLLKEYVQIHHRHLVNTNNELLTIINKKNIIIDELRGKELRGRHNTINDNKKKYLKK